MSTVPKPPEILDKIVDLVLAHKPKTKAKPDKGKKDATRKRKSASSKPPAAQMRKYEIE